MLSTVLGIMSAEPFSLFMVSPRQLGLGDALFSYPSLVSSLEAHHFWAPHIHCTANTLGISAWSDPSSCLLVSASLPVPVFPD